MNTNMSHQWKLVKVFGLASFGLILAFAGIWWATRPDTAIARGTGPGSVEINPAGIIALIVTGLGSLGFTGATVLKFVEAMVARSSWFSTQGKTNDIGETLIAVASLGQQGAWAKLYNAEADLSIKAKIRDLAKEASDAQFNRNFPIPVPPNPSPASVVSIAT